jgi:hypothetical protein
MALDLTTHRLLVPATGLQKPGPQILTRCRNLRRNREMSYPPLEQTPIRTRPDGESFSEHRRCLHFEPHLSAAEQQKGDGFFRLSQRQIPESPELGLACHLDPAVRIARSRDRVR